jgi:apolipoprotein N-acyltransferase
MAPAPLTSDHPDALKVSLVQGGVPTWLYRRASVSDRLQEVIVRNYLDLIDEALRGQPDWLVVPEAAFGKPIANGSAGLREVAGLTERRLGHSTLLLGTTHRMDQLDPEWPAANKENTVIAVVASADGMTQIGRVTKRQLVPIAEARYRPAPAWTPLHTPQATAGAQVCFESMYPEPSRTLANAGADILVVILNDAGLRWSPNAQVHARLGILRAIETGRPLVHAAQAGSSFYTDEYGRRSADLDLFERGVLTAILRPGGTNTFYAWVGDLWLAVFALLWGLCALARRKQSAMDTA